MILINLQCVIFALESAEVKNPTHCADLRQDDLQDGDRYDVHDTADYHNVENLIRMSIIM